MDEVKGWLPQPWCNRVVTACAALIRAAYIDELPDDAKREYWKEVGHAAKCAADDAARRIAGLEAERDELRETMQRIRAIATDFGFIAPADITDEAFIVNMVSQCENAILVERQRDALRAVVERVRAVVAQTGRDGMCVVAVCRIEDVLAALPREEP